MGSALFTELGLLRKMLLALPFFAGGESVWSSTPHSSEVIRPV
jgi:hypothetical protein